MATLIRNKNKRKKFTVRYHDNGIQREKSFVTSREARDFMAKFEHDSRAQIFVDPALAQIKSHVAAEQWVSRLTGAPASKVHYRQLLTDHINPVMGDRTILAVSSDRDACADFLLDVLPVRGLGPSQIRIAYVVIRAVINDAIKSGKLAKSRINGIQLPAVPTRASIIFPSFAQLEIMADKMPHPYGALIWLMRGCGLRVSEALAVRWQGIGTATLRIHEQLLADGSYGPLKARKPGEYRDVPIPAYVLERLPWGHMADDTAFLFPAAHHSNVRRWFAQARDAAGIDSDFTAHTLRHIFASVALSNGIPITDVSAWLGHRNINLTYSIYGHLVPTSWASGRTVLDDEFRTWKEAQ